jgi:CheY-like chemotaxis protein
VTAGRVLIVEDDWLLATTAQEIVEHAGFEVVAMARDQFEAVEAAVTHRPDVVLMDVRLAKGTSGITAAIEIFAKTGIRSIFVTASGDAENRMKAEPASPLGWLMKPYDPDDLVAGLRAALPSARSEGKSSLLVNHSKRFVTATPRGAVSLRDMLDYFDALVAARAMSYAKLFDARELDSRLTEDDMQALGARVRANSAFDPRGPIAAVATSPEAWAAVQRFKELAGAKRPVEIFAALNDACAWLASR